MTFGKVTSKGQVTLPKEVRKRLRLEPGDTLAYEIEEDAVRIRKVEAFNVAWHRAVAGTLEEWNSPEDDEAFGGL
jgi:antitoxin PrlF